MQCIDQYQLCYDNTCALEVDGLPAVVAKVLYLEHKRVDILGDLREEPFEVCEEGWVIKCPFGRCLMAQLAKA
jgi:hypothetical protein